MHNWLYSTVNQFRIRETPTGVIREPTGFNDAQWGATQDDDGKQWFQNGWLGVPGYFQFPIVYGTFADSNRYEKDFDEIFGAPIGLADMQGGMPVVRKPDGSLARGTAGAGSHMISSATTSTAKWSAASCGARGRSTRKGSSASATSIRRTSPSSS